MNKKNKKLLKLKRMQRKFENKKNRSRMFSKAKSKKQIFKPKDSGLKSSQGQYAPFAMMM